MAQPSAGLRDLRVRRSARPELRLAVMLMLAILVAAALASGFYFPLGERRIRPEHIAAPVLFAGFVLVQRLRKEPAVRIDAFSVLAAAWVLANAVSSWLHAPQPSE